MLTYLDDPTIRNAILKRFDGEKGVAVCDIEIEPNFIALPNYIGIAITTRLDDALNIVSRFHLPMSFELRHLHNEIDEIAEQYKAARADYWRNGRTLDYEMRDLLGTGVRGRWAQYG